ncbi:hypothetical protein ACODT3_23550 [Streptomyces sp. 4.24]|uniref:hypothetical protein n=1 Tax=Streptomyces tritrimontium TaxID=3406573 RepID=UPI003BB7D6EA
MIAGNSVIRAAAIAALAVALAGCGPATDAANAPEITATESLSVDEKAERWAQTLWAMGTPSERARACEIHRTDRANVRDRITAGSSGKTLNEADPLMAKHFLAIMDKECQAE